MNLFKTVCTVSVAFVELVYVFHYSLNKNNRKRHESTNVKVS
jgi:hypothetical protein